MTALSVDTRIEQPRRQLMRRFGVYAPVALVVYAALQLATSAAESDPERG
jgi:hypothetical protein